MTREIFYIDGWVVVVVMDGQAKSKKIKYFKKFLENYWIFFSNFAFPMSFSDIYTYLEQLKKMCF